MGNRRKRVRSDLFEKLSAVLRLRFIVALYDMGVLEMLQEPNRLSGICKKFGLRADILEGIMRFLAMDESLVRRVGSSSFVSNLRKEELQLLRIHIRKFVDAYGTCIDQMSEIMTGRACGADLVRKEALADAFSRLPLEHDAINDAILRYEPTFVVELGCGGGQQVAWLARNVSNIKIVGVDSSVAMCEAAAKTLTVAGVRDRARVVHCDAKDLRRVLPKNIRDRVDLIYGKSILNAQFTKGSASASQFLRQLSNAFPDRQFVCVDYYGELFSSLPRHGKNSQGILQDVVQLLSGQGTPPPSVELWANVYRDADCVLIHAQHACTGGIRWFIHHVRLASKM